MKRSNSPTLVTLVVAALSGPAAALEINLADSFEAADPADFGNVIGQVAVVPAGGVLAPRAAPGLNINQPGRLRAPGFQIKENQK